MAALFIGVVLAFPEGLAGVWEKHVKPRLLGKGKSDPATEPVRGVGLPATRPAV
jgi:urea transport system permease protein